MIGAAAPDRSPHSSSRSRTQALSTRVRMSGISTGRPLDRCAHEAGRTCRSGRPGRRWATVAARARPLVGDAGETLRAVEPHADHPGGLRRPPERGDDRPRPSPSMSPDSAWAARSVMANTPWLASWAHRSSVASCNVVTISSTRPRSLWTASLSTRNQRRPPGERRRRGTALRAPRDRRRPPTNGGIVAGSTTRPSAAANVHTGGRGTSARSWFIVTPSSSQGPFGGGDDPAVGVVDDHPAGAVPVAAAAA